jgi:prepilin-type N-terminal cleavage/methylation domain-containing protein
MKRYFRGFSLIEIAVVLIIIALLTTGALSMVNSLRLRQRYTDTRTNLDKVDTALVNFVTVAGRLPCPADGSLSSTNASAGTEKKIFGVCSNNEKTGVVPWRALGLSEEDSQDGWYRRFTYRVPANLTTNNAMNLTNCDPAGSTGALSPGSMCVTTCASGGACTHPVAYLAGKGVQIEDVAGTVLQDPDFAVPTGAAYVLISHGPTGGGAYNSNGILQLSADDGTRESLNYNNRNIGSPYIKDGVIDAPGAGHFDDFVTSPTILSVVTRAQTGARTH